MQPDKRTWDGLKVIDAHAHIGTFSGYDLSTPTLLSNINRYGIELALISNIDGSQLPGTTGDLNETSANEVTQTVVKDHPTLFRGLLWARPEDGQPSRLEAFLNSNLDSNGRKIFVGMKFHPMFNHIAADDSRMDPYLELCEKYKIPAVFHSGDEGSDSDPQKIYDLAKRHPNVPIVLYHMGFGTDHKRAIKVALEAKKNRDANLFLETAQVDPVTALDAVKLVGSEYVLFGTDATYFGTNHYSNYQSQINRLRDNLPAAALDKVLHGNAERLFDL